MSVVRPIIVFREITKIHEESVECTTNSGPENLSERGEFTIVVGPAPSLARRVGNSTGEEPIAVALFGHLTSISRPSRDQALDIVAEALSIDRLALKKAVKRQIMSSK
jgi:16S rRNA C1402 (ribose-2'-O) methylase RsmI